VQADGSTMAETSEFHAACAVLGLSTAPSLSEARTAFRDRAALLHPDVHQSAGTHRMNAATAAMQQLNDAYQLVLESLVAGDPSPTNDTEGHNRMTRRCTKCRSEFQYTANDALIACPRCGQGFRVRSRNRRSYSQGGSPAGRVVVYKRRPTTRQRTEPLGRLSHVRFWLTDS
jgi:DNA-directed RNA polymerase subunit RPC12/RpoP